MASASEKPVIELEHVSLAFDDKVVLKDVSFTLLPGHTKLILGASGSGKSTILKLVLGLLRPDDGAIYVNGERVDEMAEQDLLRVRGGLGMVFQEGALFDSLTVAENVGYKFYEETDMGVHGRSAFDLWLFGSNTQVVARAAPCPVLVVHG